MTIKGTVLNRLGQVVDSTLFTTSKVGNGARHFQQARLGTRRQTKRISDLLQKLLPSPVGAAESLQLFWTHARVTVETASGIVSQNLVTH